MEIDEIIELVKEKIKNFEKIPVEASGRHIHLNLDNAKKLFGENYQFNVLKELSQPGQYACKERVRLVGPKGVIEGVIILGPFRNNTQVELSVTDCKILGITPHLRESGNIDGTEGVIINNGKNFIKINKGVIVAKNHIHMTENDGEKFKVKDKELVKVKIISERPVIFQDVVVRIDKTFKLSMHIDYDEANACMLNAESLGIIMEK